MNFLKTMMKTIHKALLANTLLICILSCSSIPLSTVITFAGYDEGDIARFNPDDIKIMIDLNGGHDHLNIEETKFTVETNSRKGPLAYNFALHKITEERIPAVSQWYANTDEKKRYVTELTNASKKEFSELQVLMHASKAKFKKFNMKIAIINVGISSSTLVFSVYIKLDKAKEFILLYDDAKIDFSNNSLD